MAKHIQKFIKKENNQKFIIKKKIIETKNNVRQLINAYTEEGYNWLYVQLITLERELLPIGNEFISLSIKNIIYYYENIDNEIYRDMLNIIDYRLTEIENKL